MATKPLLDSTGKPLIAADGSLVVTDAAAWSSSFKITAAGVGAYGYRTGLGTYGWSYPIASAVTSAYRETLTRYYFPFSYGAASWTDGSYWYRCIPTATLYLTVLDSQLAWIISIVFSPSGYLKAQRIVSVDDASPVGDYDYMSSDPAENNSSFKVDGPFSVSA